MKPALLIAFVACAWLWASNEDYKDQLAMAAERSCLAQRLGERAVSEKRRDGTLQCVVFENIGAGMVPRLKYTEVWKR